MNLDCLKFLGLAALALSSAGCIEPTVEPPVPAGLATELVVSNPLGDQTPDSELPYLDRLTFDGRSWLSDLITLHRRRFGFGQLSVEPLLVEIQQQPQAADLLNRPIDAVRAAVHDGLLRARLLDARLRHEPTLQSAAPEIEASWVIYDRLRMPRPGR